MPATTPDVPPVPDAADGSYRPPLDYNALAGIGTRLLGVFQQYEQDRKLLEIDWVKSARQYLGIYDPDIDAQMDKNRSRAYPKITRVKVVSMVSRLMNMLFPASEKNWSVESTPVPNLGTPELQQVLDNLAANAQGGQLTDKMIEAAILAFAKDRAINLEMEIEDQMAELGGDRMLDYVSLVRQVVYSAVRYGTGVLEGPFVRVQKQRTWALIPAGVAPHPVTGQMVQTPPRYQAQEYDAYRPQFEFVPIWDYYPDLASKSFASMDGQFRRYVMSRHQVRKLAEDPNFFGDQIRAYLNSHLQGNYQRKMYETELKQMGVLNNVNDNVGRKYEVLKYSGYIPASDLQAAGVLVPDNLMSEEIEAVIWLIDNTVIRADINPWLELNNGLKVNMYHQFVFEDNETSLMGNGLPNIVRDSQMAVCASTRMMLDNASVVAGPQLEINTDLMRMDQDITAIQPFKVWYREGLGADAQMPALRELSISSHLPELNTIAERFQAFADMETFIGPATGGDMQKGPSEPFRTAAGASMLRGDMALPFKDVVRNFDRFTQSVISSLIAFNQQYPARPDVIGDFRPVARGSTSLIAKEVRGMILDGMAQTLSPEDSRYINRYELLRERLHSRDVDPGTVLCSKDEAAQRDEDASQQAAQQAQDQRSLLIAEVREILANTSKALTQAGKNQALADVAQTNTILKGLQHGVEQAEAGGAGGTPAGALPGAGGIPNAATTQVGGAGVGANQGPAPVGAVGG